MSLGAAASWVACAVAYTLGSFKLGVLFTRRMVWAKAEQLRNAHKFGSSSILVKDYYSHKIVDA